MSACVFVTTHEECNTSTSPGGFKEKKGNPLPDQGHVDNFVIYNESSAAPRSKTYTVMTPAGTHTRLHTCLQPAVTLLTRLQLAVQQEHTGSVVMYEYIEKRVKTRRRRRRRSRGRRGRRGRGGGEEGEEEGEGEGEEGEGEREEEGACDIGRLEVTILPYS